MSDSVDLQLTKLLEMIKSQADLMHKWVATLLAVQAGVAIALWFVWTSTFGQLLRIFATSGVAVVAIVGTIVCCEAAIGDLRWQGRFIGYYKSLDERKVIFGDCTPSLEKLGRKAKLLRGLEILLGILWLLMIAISIFVCFK